jgi:hypothetical protein
MIASLTSPAALAGATAASAVSAAACTSPRPVSTAAHCAGLNLRASPAAGLVAARPGTGASCWPAVSARWRSNPTRKSSPASCAAAIPTTGTVFAAKTVIMSVSLWHMTALLAALTLISTQPPAGSLIHPREWTHMDANNPGEPRPARWGQFVEILAGMPDVAPQPALPPGRPGPRK